MSKTRIATTLFTIDFKKAKISMQVVFTFFKKWNFECLSDIFSILWLVLSVANLPD